MKNKTIHDVEKSDIDIRLTHERNLAILEDKINEMLDVLKATLPRGEANMIPKGMCGEFIISNGFGYPCNHPKGQCPVHDKKKIEIVPSGRIDYCCQCDRDHGYDCPFDKGREQGEQEERSRIGKWAAQNCIQRFGQIAVVPFLELLSAIDEK